MGNRTTRRQVATTDDLRYALKLAALLIETKAPTNIDGTLVDPWDELLEHINAVLDGKQRKRPGIEVLRRFIRHSHGPLSQV